MPFFMKKKQRKRFYSLVLFNQNGVFFGWRLCFYVLLQGVCVYILYSVLSLETKRMQNLNEMLAAVMMRHI